MCGRAAQTFSSVRAAAHSLGVTPPTTTTRPDDEHATSGDPEHSTEAAQLIPDDSSSNFLRDNFNMSPGMDAVIFRKDSCGDIQMERKVWGLVTKSGTSQAPLPTGMNQHYSNLMFNARSDTLFQKPTFARLAGLRKTCVVAFHGFFEWKTVTGKKQPYFVYRKQQDDSQPCFLLLAGLWTSVQTGRAGDPVLDTFTILTQEACKELEWLHSRMPLCIWNNDRAREWLEHPSEKLLKGLETENHDIGGSLLQWHAVSPSMSSTKLRSMDAIKALPPMKTVKSFFPVISKEEQRKRKAESANRSPEKASPSSKKKAKSSPVASNKSEKGTIMSFFSPKGK